MANVTSPTPGSTIETRPVFTPTAEAAAQAVGATSAASAQRALLGSAMGDSITAQSGGRDNATTSAYNSIGYAAWVRILSKGAVDLPPEYIKGVGGQNYQQMLDRISDITSLSPQPDFCMIEGANAGPTLLAMKTAVAGMVKALLAKGITPVILANMPAAGEAANIRKIRVGFNRWAHDMARNKAYARNEFSIPAGFVVFSDAGRNFIDGTTVAGEPLAKSVSDGLHWDVTGAYVVAAEVVADLTRLGMLVGARSNHLTGADIYDATDNPLGNRVTPTAAVMFGTGGTISTGTGQLATGLTFRRWVGDSTSAVTLSKASHPDGSGNRQRVQISTTAAGTMYDLYQLFPAVQAVTAGEAVSASVEFSVAAGNVGAVTIQLVLVCGGYTYDGKVSDPTRACFPVTAVDGKLQTARVTVPGGATTAEVYIEIWMKGTLASQTLDASFYNLKFCRDV